MTRVLTAVLFAVALAPTGASATCLGGYPVITHVTVEHRMTSNQVTRYHLVGTVTNNGTQGQPANTLQSVDILHDGDKLDSRGIPPLSLGASYHFTYDFMRAEDAGADSTTLTFRVDMQSGNNMQSESSCNPANHVYSITF